jgi:hypothetical protein
MSNVIAPHLRSPNNANTLLPPSFFFAITCNKRVDPGIKPNRNLQFLRRPFEK